MGAILDRSKEILGELIDIHAQDVEEVCRLNGGFPVEVFLKIILTPTRKVGVTRIRAEINYIRDRVENFRTGEFDELQPRLPGV